MQSGFLEKPDDLSRLKLIDADSVNKLGLADLGGKDLVLQIATGGTLAMATKKEGVRVPVFNWQEILSPIAGLLQNRFEIKGLNAFCIDSSQMDYSHVRELAIVVTYLCNNIKVPFLGFLITHGTDTMSYSAAALSLMMGRGLPVSIVYTGAQKPLEDPMSDIPLNFRNSLNVLKTLHDKDMAEVLIVMGDRALLATSAEKVSDTNANAFDSPRHNFAAKLNNLHYPVLLAEWLNQRQDVEFKPKILVRDYSRTLVIKSVLGLDPKVLKRQVADADILAVILYSYGTGAAHKDILTAVKETAKKRNIPVFIVSPVNTEYHAEYASAKAAMEMGIIPLNMNLSAALAKIEIALNLYRDDLGTLAKFMQENYCGEVPTELSGIAL